MLTELCSSVVLRERLGYESSRFEVRLRRWVAIFSLCDRNTLNKRSNILQVSKKMAATVLKGKFAEPQYNERITS